eukprot:gene25798-31564_t
MLDTDSDGGITLNELIKAMKNEEVSQKLKEEFSSDDLGDFKAVFNAMDLDGDERVSVEEFEDKAAIAFGKHGTPHQDVISNFRSGAGKYTYDKLDDTVPVKTSQ